MSQPKSSYDGFAGRKNWSLEMQNEFAIPIYEHYWQVRRDDDIVEVDTLGESEEAAARFDYSGIDKLVTPETGKRHIAQRFRKNNQRFSVDFSLRLETPGSDETEYHKLLNAYRNDGNYPSVYAFGIGRRESKQKCLKEGFQSFYFIRMSCLLGHIDGGELTPVSGSPNGDGSRALYYSIDDLWKYDCIQDHLGYDELRYCWGDQDDTVAPTAPGISRPSGKQSGLTDFGGGD